MRIRPVLLLLMVLIVMSMLAPAVAEPPLQPILLGQQPTDDGGTSSTFQVAGCYRDATGDVRRGVDGPLEPAPQADVTEYCLDYNAASLGVSMTVPQGTDPATDRTWDNLGAGAVFLYETVAGAPREIQLSTQRGDGVFEYFVLEGTVSPSLVCSGNAVFDAGTYRASIPADCLDAADQLQVMAGFLYERSSGAASALTDLAPADGEFVEIPRTAPAGADRVTRLAGGSRVETAIAISQASFQDGQAGAVVVALADNFPDALVAAPLAVARQAPVLLTPGTSVPESVLSETQRALGGTGDVILLGGTAALSPAVVTAFESAGHEVTRIAGDSRFATSVAVAEAANPNPERIVLAFGGDFPDALLAGALAPTRNGVAVLVDRSGVPGVVQEYLDANPSAQTLTMGNVATEAFPGADSAVTGSTPSLISGALLSVYPPGGEVAVASVEAFPDGLAGGAYAAARGIPLVLSPRDSMTEVLLQDLGEFGPYEQITFLGGVAALSETTAGQAAAHLQ